MGNRSKQKVAALLHMGPWCVPPLLPMPSICPAKVLHTASTPYRTAAYSSVADRNAHATDRVGLARPLLLPRGLELYSLRTGVRGAMDTPQAIGKPRIREG